MEYIESAFGDYWPGAVYALAIFCTFSYISSNISDNTNAKVGNWIKGRHLSQEDLRKFLIESFSVIYGKNLLSLSAFIRSSIISLVVTFFVIYHTYEQTIYIIFSNCCGVSNQFVYLIIGNIFIDYFSVITIKEALVRIRPAFMGIFAGPIIGFLMALAGLTIVDVVRFSIETRSFSFRYYGEGVHDWLETLSSEGISSRKSIFLGALFVHLWVIILSMGAIIARVVNSLRNLTKTTQSIIKDGDTSPVKAIGYVAGLLTLSIYLAIRILT